MNYKLKKIAYLLLIFVIVSCSAGNDSVIKHPTKKNLPSGEEANVIYTGKANQSKDISISDNFSILPDNMQKVSSIGQLYGEKEEMFGFIQDVIIDSFNRIFFLDSNQQLIQVFNTSGKYITTVGKQGEGPGEFERAQSMINYKNKLLLVSNGYRIEIYDIDSKKTIKFLETIQLKNWAHSICTLGDTLFVHNTRLIKLKEGEKEKSNIHMVHAYEIPSFKLLFSFGKPYKSSAPMVVNRMSSGIISCNESSSTVTFAFEEMPVLHGYSAKDGSLKWQSKIEGLHFANITQTKNDERKTRMTFEIPENNTIDQIHSIITLEDEYESLQIRRLITPDGSYETKREVLSYVLNSKNGKATFISKKIPAIVNISNNLIVTVSGDFITSQLYKSKF